MHALTWRLFALLLCIQAPAQVTPNPNQTGESVFTHVNRHFRAPATLPPRQIWRTNSSRTWRFRRIWQMPSASLTASSTGQSNSNCPNTITLTAALPIFPPGYSINASSYTEAEALVASNSITASLQRRLQYPLLPQPAFSAVVFIDPTVNLVLGAASFDNIQRTTTTA